MLKLDELHKLKDDSISLENKMETMNKAEF